MSSKINVCEIILGHIATLSDPAGKRSFSDYITFFLIPGGVALIGVFSNYNLNKDVSSMLVNFGAIFTALLLSVLVLVYDQEGKLNSVKDSDPLYEAKKKLLNNIYYNICFSILSSIVLVALCFVHSVVFRLKHDFAWEGGGFSLSYSRLIITPVIIFVTANLLLTIVMIVKRLHAMLTM